MKYAIIGTGAIGGYYGGMLARYGHDIHFLFRSDFSYVKEHGLKIDSINGNFILPKVNAYSSPTEMPKCDAAIITLKTTQNGELAKILPNILKKDGIIITLQNGLGFEKDIASILPEAVILSGICNIASNKVGPGHINHMYYGKITLAEYLPEYKTGFVQFLYGYGLHALHQPKLHIYSRHVLSRTGFLETAIEQVFHPLI